MTPNHKHALAPLHSVVTERVAMQLTIKGRAVITEE
jgi:hypothetical protein